jgi:hypothetical protein
VKLKNAVTSNDKLDEIKEKNMGRRMSKRADVELLHDIGDDLSDGAFFALMGEMDIDVGDLLEVYDEIEEDEENMRWRHLQVDKMWIVYSENHQVTLQCVNKDQAVMLCRVLNQNGIKPILPLMLAEKIVSLKSRQFSEFPADDSFGEGIEL